MTPCWRITRPEYAPGLDGAGARKAGGRWNSAGRSAVYCGGSLALAALEVFVHLPPSMRTSDKLPRLVAVQLELPDDLPVHEIGWTDLPGDPKIGDYRDVGDRWLSEGRFAVLSVPSLIIGVERNYVLNPHHPDFARVRLVGQQDFLFDGRMAT